MKRRHTMNTLDLFCGTKSFSKEAEKKGYNTITVDILEKFNPTHLTDILEWDYKQYPQHYFHIIWASPNCKDYSRMNFLSKKKKDLSYSNSLIKKVIEIIEYFDPKYWYIENPQTGLLKKQEFMDYLPYNDVDYCKYGHPIRKRTRLWNNNENWEGEKLCIGKHRCEIKKKTNKHFEFRWITRGKGVINKWEQRIMIPADLIKEIIESCY